MGCFLVAAVLAVGADPTAADKAAFKAAYERALAGEVVEADLTYVPAFKTGQTAPTGRVRLQKKADRGNRNAALRKQGK